MAIDQNKVAQLQHVVFEELYVPAVIETFNEKAAQVGLKPIDTQERLVQALDTIGVIQAELAKVAAASDPLEAVHTKLASAGSDYNGQAGVNFVKQAGSNARLISVLQSFAK